LRSYTYDHANRLTQVVSGTLTTQFTYNGAGDRVAKTVDGVTTDYVLDPAAGLTQVLQETTGGQATAYLYGHDLLAQYDSGTWAYHVDDGLGSVRQLADPVGQVVQGYSFSPFGVPLGESGGEPYGFTGEQWDSSAGLVYLRARYYEPGVGRFTQRDIWSGGIYRPRTRNGFDYASGNPVRFTDPSGFCTYGEPNYFECVQLAELLARAYGQPVGSAPGTFLEKHLRFVQMSYEELQDLWAQLDPAHSQERYDIIEQEATRFGLPAEFIAAVIAAEVEYDTDWINTVYDAWTTCLDLELVPAFPGSLPPWVHLELWHYYYGAGPLYLNPEHGYGEGPAPGIGNIHAGVAAEVEQYFATTYPDEDLLPPAPSNGRRLRLLRRYEWSVRYVAAYLRQLADIRTGREGPHPDLTDNDMEMIFILYHAHPAYCFGDDDPLGEFQCATRSWEPACQRFADQLGPFLDLYRRR
jgi:RHS repeat-associated protein